MDRLGRRSRPAAPSPDGAPRPDSEGVDGGSPEGRSQVWRALARFAFFGTIALLAVVAGTIVIAEKATRGEMLRHAQRTTASVAETIIAPLADEDLRDGDPGTVSRLDDVMKARMKDGSVLRVKVWSEDGTVLWSDDPRLIGRRFELEPQDAALLSTLGSSAEFTTLDREENVFDPQVGEVAEVYDGFTDRTGRPLLLELYVPVGGKGGVEKESRAQVRTLLPLTVGGPALMLLILLPLALSMARRIDDAGAERSALLRHAVAASALERRRIAGDLHDGVVQDLAGIGYALPAIGSSLPDGPDTHEARQGLEKVTEVVQRDLSALRSVITDIYPPDLNQGGLLPATQMLVSEVRYSGVEVELDVDPTVSEATLPTDTAVLGYRVLRESLRNVTRHSGASRARVALRVEDGDLVIVVADDGVGFDPDAPSPEGHFGLRLLQDTVRHVGGSLRIVSAPHRGAEVTARFPATWSSSP
jgi:signal transduction histidine kinase